MVGGVGARVRSTLMAIGVVLCDDRDRRSFIFRGRVSAKPRVGSSKVQAKWGCAGPGSLGTFGPITTQVTHLSRKLGPRMKEVPVAASCSTVLEHWPSHSN